MKKFFTKSTITDCGCELHQRQRNFRPQPKSRFKQLTQTIGSIGVSIFIALFPKCPVCLAAYMSMLGGVGIRYSPYAHWMLPFLSGFLGLHLWLVYRQTAQKGYLPFSLSVLGSSLLLAERLFGWQQDGLIWTGVLFIFTGSLLHSSTELSRRVAQFSPFKFFYPQ